MARILSIDYGTKRTGVAVTDPLQIIANGLDTVPTEKLFEFLKEYIAQEQVEIMVVGEPKHADGNPTHLSPKIKEFIQQFQKLYPEIEVVMQDERYTSVDAKRILLQSGAKKKKRRDKSLIDKISAVLILQQYLEKKNY